MLDCRRAAPSGLASAGTGRVLRSSARNALTSLRSAAKLFSRSRSRCSCSPDAAAEWIADLELEPEAVTAAPAGPLPPAILVGHPAEAGAGTPPSGLLSAP